MIPLASLRAGCRRAALMCVPLVALLLPVPAAQAQRLLTLVPGVGQAASAGDLGPSIGPVPTAVQVDLALLRGAPVRLEVPTPEGGVLSAERSVFEDRGGGDLMWSGGQPGAGYDTVVLTVEGGRLVGRFAAAGGGAYQIHAERDGLGGMAPLGGPAPEDWCGVDAGAEDGHAAHAHGRARAHAADLLERVSDPQSHDRLDILVVYTATAAENWADRGGAHAAIRHAGDYLKMVFRNNSLPVEPHIVHIAQASAALDRAGRVLDRHDLWFFQGSNPLWKQMNRERSLLRLQHEHRADFVHVFTGEHHLLLKGACGGHRQFRKGDTARGFSDIARGWTSNHPGVCGDYAVTFAHEIGHGLGAHHDRANIVPPLAANSARRKALESLFRPDSLGYPNFDVMPSLGTAMSYLGQTEPFFSTPRIRPWGAAVGIADEADNERTLRETVHIGVRFSDYLRSLDGVPAQPTNLEVRFDGGAAHLSWRDNAPDADWYEVQGIWESEYLWESQDRELSGGGIWEAVKGRTGATLPLEYTEPGSLYRFEVQAIKGGVRSLRSSGVWLVVPGEPIAAPSDVSVVVASNLREVDVRWTDNSDNEWAFEVQLLKNGEPIRRLSYYWPDDERAEFLADKVQAEAGAEYGVRVFAYNSSGYSESSETAMFRWEHPLAPGPVADVAATAVGPAAVRVAWTPDPEVERYIVRAELRAWRYSRRWRPPRDGSASAAWVDFEVLPRGGRYKFSVTPWGGLDSDAYLTLGERGRGPRAPSNVSWTTDDDGAGRLSWKDNSSDELGFEVQATSQGVESWWRVGTAPPDTESVVVADVAGTSPNPKMGSHVVRVFAYNARGYSVSSPRVPGPAGEPPSSPGGSCRAGAEALCLQDSRFEVRVNWWKADGEAGVGRVVEEGTDDSGMFQFFDPSNWEVLVKVLDGCATNGHMWVLGASTTDLGYRIVVTDTITEESRTYTNEPGRPAPAIVDTKAFSLACVAGSGS